MLCDNREGLNGVGCGRRFKREGTYAYLWLIHADLWHKPAQYCKAIMYQWKINKFKLKIKMNSKWIKDLNVYYKVPRGKHMQNILRHKSQ